VNRLVSGVGRSEAQYALFLAALLNQTVTEDPADTNTFDQALFARSFLGYGAVSARILKAAQHFCPWQVHWQMQELRQQVATCLPACL